MDISTLHGNIQWMFKLLSINPLALNNNSIINQENNNEIYTYIYPMSKNNTKWVKNKTEQSSNKKIINNKTYFSLFLCSMFILYPKAIIRITIVILNNIYSIPTYVIWMIMLLPIKRCHPDLYFKIEGLFFHWLLSVVSMWSWTAGYDSK